MNSFHARQGRPKSARPEPPTVVLRQDRRADQRLVAAQLAASRSAARKLIASGRVSWRDGGVIRPVAKPAEILPDGGEFVVDPE